MSLKADLRKAHDEYLKADNPEASAIIDNFAFGEVLDEVDLPDRTRLLSNLAYLLGCQGIDEFKLLLPVALKNGVSPEEAREVVYQAVDYLGLGRVLPFYQAIKAADLPKGATVGLAEEERLEAGEATQIRLFGPQMKDFAKKGTINKWLVKNCFGDYYTRTKLNDQDREMITFCYLAAQGGVEPQLKSHAQANVRNGNDQEFLRKIVLANEPFIGYPRSLNALNIVNNL